MVQQELSEKSQDVAELENNLKILLLPKDANDEKSVIMEIRAGAGGEEAALFAHSLVRMYTMYAERRGWTLSIVSENMTELGGVKEVSAEIEGAGAWSRLKFEAGTHRVQRVPETESGGRIHTSAATVAVLPEAEEVDVKINPGDLRIDIYRAGGHGGQGVNTLLCGGVLPVRVFHPAVQGAQIEGVRHLRNAGSKPGQNSGPGASCGIEALHVGLPGAVRCI